MSDREHRRSRHDNSARRSSRHRHRTPDGKIRQMMEEMLSRLSALEERSTTRPSRSREQSEPRAHDGARLQSPAPPQRRASPPSRRHTPPLRDLCVITSPPQRRLVASPDARLTTPRVPDPAADGVPTPLPPQLLRPTSSGGSRMDQAFEGSFGHVDKEASTSAQPTVTDRIVDAIRSINTTVRSNQNFYISRFDPNLHNIDDWCEEVDRAKSMNNWSDYECLSRIGNCLRGDARLWLNEWVTNDRSWSNFKREFKPLCPKTPDIANILFEVMCKNSDEYPTYADYARRSLLRLRIVRGLSDELISAIVIRGITDPHIRASATNAKLLPDDLVKFFSIYVKTNATKTGANRNMPQVTYNTRDRHNHNSGSRKRRFEDGKCFSCGLKGHTQATCKRPKTDSVQSSVNSRSNSASISKPSFVPTKTEPCSFCKKTGHKIDTCFAKLKAESRSKSDVNFCRETLATRNSDVIVAVIQGIPVDILIDSGSTISLVSSSILRHFYCARKPTFRVLKGLGSQEIESTSYVTLPVEFDDITLEVDLFIVASEYMNTPIIVGTDVLNREGVRYVRTCDSQYLTRTIEKPDRVMTVQSDSSVPINTSLVGEQLEQLLTIINEFSDYFISGTATSTVNTGEMCIKLNCTTPVNYRPYRLSHHEMLRVREIIKDLLEKKIIRESESDYASPILLVKKKDGSDRMCVDFRKLNDVTIKDRFPLPRIDDHIDRLGQSQYFSCLDMATGFHQIPLQEGSVHLTGFVTPEGHYEYLKMPYGLANAPVVYQRIIAKTLHKFIESGDVLVYIDDVLLMSNSITQGLVLLREVLMTLTAAGFSVNLRKCSFLTTEVEYLGRSISCGQVRPSHNKVKALVDSIEPKNVKQVRQFMGLASYFRRYIPNFAQRTACMASLTKKGIEFSWGPEQQAVMWKIQLILNITKHRSTQYSPLNLLVGIDAATPLIRSLVRDVALEGSSPNREALREMGRQRASERLRQNQNRQDAYVNAKRKSPQVFNLGSLVFVRKQAQSTGKLDSCMRGPYRVTKILPHGRYELQLLAGSYGKSTQAAAEYMILWRGEWTPDVCAAYFDGADLDGEESTTIVLQHDESSPRATQPSASDGQQPSTSQMQSSHSSTTVEAHIDALHKSQEDQPVAPATTTEDVYASNLGHSLPMVETDVDS